MPNPTSPPRTIVTGFGPFLDVVDNPSSQVARALGRRFEVLEVSFDAVDRFLEELDPESFDCLMLVGVAKGRTQVTPEIFARNHIGHTKDVRGIDRFGPIDAEAPLLVEGRLWGANALYRALPNPSLKASLDAGSYLCNYTYFRALQRFPDKRVGFLHVPDVPEMPIEDQIRLAGRLLEDAERLNEE